MGRKINVITNSRSRSVASIARLLNLSRPTVYDRLDKKDWRDSEIAILKENKII